MKTKKFIIISICIFLVAITLISVGLYISSLSRPKNVMSKSIYFVRDIGNKYLISNKYIGDTYTMNTSIDFNLDSEYYKRLSSTDLDSNKKFNIINNISNMDTKLVFLKDVSKKSLYMDLSMKIKDEELLGYKKYVNNSTEYYFINGILDNYVNNGSCNYFESISLENTSKDNIDYLYNFIFKSLDNNMKDEYFKAYEVYENINSQNTSVNQLSIKITNKRVREILNNILKDLKKDKKANNILSNVYKDFNKYKVKDNTNYFKRNEYYILNIYTTKFLYKPLKYEIIHMNGDEKESIIIERNKSINLYYLEDDKVTYTSSIKVLNNSIVGKIYDSSTNEIGEFNLEKKSNDLLFNYSFDSDNNKIIIKYSSKYDKIKKNSYINNKKLDIKYLVSRESKLNGSILVKSEVMKNTDIDVDVNNAIFYSKLSSEKKDLIKNKFKKIKERLER